jgi:hypothetical protein
LDTGKSFPVWRKGKKAAQRTSQQHPRILSNETMHTEPESVELTIAPTMLPQDINSTTEAAAKGITPEKPAIAVNTGQDEETGIIEQSDSEVKNPTMTFLVSIALLAIVTAVNVCIETLIVIITPPCSIAGRSNFRVSCNFNPWYDGGRSH